MADETKNRSRQRWREMGFHVENSEFFVDVGGGRKVKKDIFGFADLIAVPTTPRAHPLVFIQATSWQHVPTRRRKILTETTGKGQWEIELARIALGIIRSGNRIVIEGWKKEGRLWVTQPRIHWMTEGELYEVLR